MKGVLLPDHIPLNKYELRVRDLPPITFITISGTIPLALGLS